MDQVTKTKPRPPASPRIVFCARLPLSVASDLRRVAAERQKPMNAIVTEALWRFIHNRGGADGDGMG
jgi:hypothetical protein